MDRVTSGISVSRFALEVGVASGVLAFGVVTIVGATQSEIGWQGGPKPGYMPLVVGIIIAFSALGILTEALIRKREFSQVAVTGEQLGFIIALFFPLLVFVGSITVLGIYVSIAVYMATMLKWQGHYRYITSIAGGAIASAACYALFEVWFKLPLPKGPIEKFFGIYFLQ